MQVKIALEAILIKVGCTDIEYRDFTFFQDKSLIVYLNFKFDNSPIEVILHFKERNLSIDISLNDLSKNDLDVIINTIKVHKAQLIKSYKRLFNF